MSRVFGVARKDNSYYCLATSSGSWYSPRFSNRLIDRCENGYGNDDYLWLLVPQMIKDRKMQDNRVKTILTNYINDYPDPNYSTGTMENPLLFLTYYNYWKYYVS